MGKKLETILQGENFITRPHFKGNQVTQTLAPKSYQILVHFLTFEGCCYFEINRIGAISHQKHF